MKFYLGLAKKVHSWLVLLRAAKKYIGTVLGLANAHRESLDDPHRGGLWNEDFQQIIDQDVIDDLFTCVACDYLDVPYPEH